MTTAPRAERVTQPTSSPTEKLLASIANKPVKSTRANALLREARRQVVAAARGLATNGSCSVGHRQTVAANMALTRASDAGVPYPEVAAVQRDLPLCQHQLRQSLPDIFVLMGGEL